MPARKEKDEGERYPLFDAVVNTVPQAGDKQRHSDA
jgi:hypothetical protein